MFPVRGSCSSLVVTMKSIPMIPPVVAWILSKACTVRITTKTYLQKYRLGTQKGSAGQPERSFICLNFHCNVACLLRQA